MTFVDKITFQNVLYNSSLLKFGNSIMHSSIMSLSIMIGMRVWFSLLVAMEDLMY